MTRNRHPQSQPEQPPRPDAEGGRTAPDWLRLVGHTLLRVRQFAEQQEQDERRKLLDGILELTDCVHTKIGELDKEHSGYEASLARILPLDENPVVREIGSNMLWNYHNGYVKSGFAGLDPATEANRWVTWFDAEPDEGVRTALYDHVTTLVWDTTNVVVDVSEGARAFASILDAAFNDPTRVIDH